MQFKLKYISVFLTIAFFLVAFLSVKAQDGNSSKSSEKGSAFVNILGKVLELGSDGGSIMIITSSGDKINVAFDERIELRKIPAGETTLRNAANIEFKEIVVGDAAVVRGKFLKPKTSFLARQIIITARTDIEEKEKKRREEWRSRGIAGNVKQVDLNAGKILIQKRDDISEMVEIFTQEDTVFQRYETNAANMNDYKSSDINAIKAGDQVRVLTKQDTNGQVVAEEIFSGFFRTIIGKVNAVNKEERELSIIDIKNEESVTVVVSDGANIRRLTEKSIESFMEKSQISRPEKKADLKGNNEKINLTAFLKQSPKVKFSEFKAGETIVIACVAPLNAKRIVGITIVSGMDLLSAQLGKTRDGKDEERYNLDVF